MIESHVVNLELSKRLKELGVKQESIFVWAKDAYIFNEGGYGIRMNHNDGVGISAFLSSELGELLPEGIMLEKFSQVDGEITYSAVEGITDTYQEFIGKTACSVLALMLIYLLENNLCQV